MVKVVPVIMSGGSGTRLWPLSTDERPKQFHALGTGGSLFQDTLTRVSSDEPSLSFTAPAIIGGARHRELILRELEQAGAGAAAVVLEPVPRGTAPAAVVAARLALGSDPAALVLLLPADHVVTDPAAFRRAVAAGAGAASDRIVVLGIEPSGPETGYGYIRRGEALGGGVFNVDGFTEKPELETARRYLAEGGYDWNAGIFLFSPQVLLAEMARAAPDILAAAEAAFAGARRDGNVLTLDHEAFAACRSNSIDYAIMERAPSAVVPTRMGWADVGSWSELARLGTPDGDRNVVHGDGLAVESDGCLVWAAGRKVAVLGLSDVVVVETADAVLVLPKARAQEVRRVVDEIRRAEAAARSRADGDS